MAPLMGLVVMLALLGGVFSVDIGLLYDGREQARMAADMAALAAVQELPQDEAEANAVAIEYAAQNGFDCGLGGPLAPGWGCDDGTVRVVVMAGDAYDGDPSACSRPGHCVHVTVEREWDWLFGALLRLPPAHITASAVGQSGAEPRDVMVVLDRSGSMCFDIDGGVSGGGGSGNGGCETASKSSLVGLDMTASGNLNVNTPVASLPSLNVPFSAANPSGFTINGVSFTYNPAVNTLNQIAAMINGSAANVTASFSTGSDARLTLSSTIFGGGAQINIDDGTPAVPAGNFFFATRMLDANLVPTRLVGRDVGSQFNYPNDLNEPLADLNSFDANLDVDFALVPGGSTFCINGVTGVEPCTATSIPYNTNESLNTIITRINNAGAGVTASFASDVFTLTRNANGPVPISIADGAGGNFLQAMRLLQVPTFATAVGGDMADCTGPGGVDACFDGADLPVAISTLNDELLEDLVPVPTPHVLGSGEFKINGVTIPYASTDSLNTILANITASPAGVTATVQTGTDQLVLTQKTAGDQPILFEDVVTNHGVGNFLQSMRFISPVRRTTVQGLNVEGTLGNNFDVANDLTVPLGQLDDELEVDFAIGAGRLCIRVVAGPCDDDLPGNGVKIDYTAADAGGSTLSTILAAINNPANGTGVMAEIVGDRLTLKRNAYGAGPIIVADITGSFFSSMRLLGGTKTIALGGIVGNLTAANLTTNLNTLNTPMTVDFANIPNGSFEINDIVFTYNAGTDTITEIITAINASAAADVTASFDVNTDKFMLTRDTIGPLDITFSDLSGNFFQAMQFLAGGTATTAVGLDVGGVAGDIVAGDLNLLLNNGGLALKTAPDFLPVINGRIRINGVDVPYNATTTTLNQVITAINTSNAAVTASFDVVTDKLTLTRNAPGATEITFADVTGNFFQVIRFVEGGGYSTAVGLDVATTGTAFDNADLNVAFNAPDNLNDELDVDFVAPGSFLINGVTINYTSASTLNGIKTLIDASAAGVTATYNTTDVAGVSDRMTLTNNAPGAVPIEFSDTTGNFFRAMKFLAGSRTTAVGGDVASCGGCDITDSERGSNLTGGTPNGDMTIDFVDVPDGSFLINGASILYDADVDTINTIMGKIDASVGADVTATFDNNTDRLTFTRDTYGDLPIDMVDVVGNFLHAMQMVAPPTYTTVVGLDVGNLDTNDYEDSDLDALDDELTVDFLPVTNGSLTINGVTILYNAQTDELDDLVAYITASAADVTASFSTGNDQFTLTRKTTGNLDITYNDNVGNFFAAMQLLNPGTRTTAVSGPLGGFNEGDLGDDLDTLGGELNPVDLQLVANGEFLINGASITYSSAANTNDSLNDVITRINDSVGADVTATFYSGTDRLTFTRDSYGPLLITMQDVTGNFLAAFQMVGGTFTTAVGLHVAECGGCDISPSNGGNDDPNDQLIDLNEELLVPFVGGAGSFTVNGTSITYNTGSDTLNSILNKINNGAGGVGPVPDVTASFDANDPDVMTLVRDTAGNLPIDLVDVTGNFFQAMRLLSAGTQTTIVGLDVADCNGGNGNDSPCDIVATGQGSAADEHLHVDGNDTLNEDLTVDVVATAVGSFTIQSAGFASASVTYNTAVDTIDSIISKINDGPVFPIPPGGGGVPDITASFDPNGSGGPGTLIDRLVLTRDSFGTGDITLADNVGNFLQAMRLITQSGGSASTVTGGDVGTLVNANSNGNGEELNTLDALLDVDFQRVSNGSFLINGVSVSYNALNDTLAEVMSNIGTTPGTGVTAAFTDAGNFLRLTAVAPGGAPITFSDVNGNFMEAMKLATSTRVSLEGADVDGGANTFDSSDLALELPAVNTNVTLVVPFATTTATQLPAQREFSINGISIPYAASTGSGFTLNSIVTAINTSAAGVIATIDTNTDKLKLTRTAPGPQPPITVADSSGNFFQAMRFLEGGSRRTAIGDDVGGAAGDLSNANLSANMNTLTVANLKRLFQTGGDLTFTIRGTGFTYNASNDSILEIIGEINASVAADVTATFDTSTDRLTVTRDTLNAPAFTAGDFVDGTGNFLRAMGMIAAGDSFTTLVGDDVGSNFNEASDLTVRLSLLNGGGGSAASFDQDFDLTDAPRVFTINGASITFCPQFGGSTTCDGTAPSAANSFSTLNSIVASINLAANGTGVTASIDTGSADAMTLTRTTAGPLDITLADIDGGNPNGNFLDAMQMFGGTKTFGALANSGATFSGGGGAATCVAPCATTVGTTPTYVTGTSGTNPTIAYNGKTLGANGGASIPGTVTFGSIGAILATITPGTLGSGYLGTKTFGGPGGLIALITLGVPESTLAVLSTGGAVTNLTLPQNLGTEPTAVAVVVLGLEAMVGNVDFGVVPPGVVQNVIATITDGLDATDLLAELLLGDDPAVGHLIATFTLSNHRPLDEPPVHFWAPFGPVQRAAGLFTRYDPAGGPSTDFVPGVDQIGLASFSTDAALDLGLDDAADSVLLDHFGDPGSDFERALLGLVPAGATNIGGGICMALNELRLPAAQGGTAPYGHGREDADQIIVLLSDGEPNRTGGAGCPVVGSGAVAGCTDWGGTVPNGADEYSLYLACLAKLAGVTIHTIGLGLGINEDLMIEIAAITGGRYFDADTSADLDAQFEAISNVLGISLTQ